MRIFLVSFCFAAAALTAAPASYQNSFYFEPNRGQAPADVRFVAGGGGVTVLVEDRAISTSHKGRGVVRMQLEGGLRPRRTVGIEPLPGVSNYLDRLPNVVDVPHFGGVQLDGVYPGVDLVYKANASQFEYDFHVAAGADPAAIRLRFSGTPRLSPEGDLLLATTEGELRQHRPVAFQDVDGERVEVSVRFELNGSQVKFGLGEYDHSRPLVIDPPITYMTYLGDGNFALPRMHTDGTGALYFVGSAGIQFTNQSLGSFPNGSGPMSVTKFSATGQIVYSTVFDMGSSFPSAVDSTGAVYAAGYGAVANNDNPVLLKLNAAGNALIFRNAIPFSDVYPVSIAVDGATNIYVMSTSRFASNPNAASNRLTATAGAMRTTSSSGALLKFNPAGTTTIYRTFLPDEGRDLAVDSDGAAYTIVSNLRVWKGGFTQFPLGQGISKINPQGTGQDYIFDLTPVGVSSTYGISRIAVNASKELVLAGNVTGGDLPVVNAIQPTRAGSTDIYLAKINAAGTALAFCTHYGGTGFDGINNAGGLAVEPNGDIWVGGWTSSTNIPLLGATQSALAGTADGFLAKYKGDGSALLFATYFGSSAAEDAGFFSYSVAADAGAGYMVVYAPRGMITPVNAVQPTFVPANGTRNYVIAKFGTTTLPNSTPTVTSVVPAFGAGTSTTRTFVFTDPDGAANLGVVNVLVNSALDGRNACYLAYDSVGKVLVLLRDNGLEADVLVLPSNGTLSNSQCSIAGSSVTAVKSGNTLTLTLTFNFTFGATRIFYAAARDTLAANSGWQAVGTQTIGVLAANPQPLSTTPNSGVATGTVALTTQYRDATSSLNLQPVQLLINDALTGLNACYFGFDHAGNFLYIVGDTGTLQPTPIRLNGAAGGAVSIENSQCRVLAAGSTFTDSGTTLTTTLQLQFKAGFSGRRLIFAGAQTSQGANSGWAVLGSLTVP